MQENVLAYLPHSKYIYLFVVYLMTVSVAEMKQRENLEIVWHEPTVIKFRFTVTKIARNRWRKPRKCWSQKSQCLEIPIRSLPIEYPFFKFLPWGRKESLATEAVGRRTVSAPAVSWHEQQRRNENWQQETRALGEKPAPVAVWPKQIQHKLPSPWSEYCFLNAFCVLLQFFKYRLVICRSNTLWMRSRSLHALCVTGMWLHSDDTTIDKDRFMCYNI
jgi:hypothetical protein